jgi:hypothetical protein
MVTILVILASALVGWGARAFYVKSMKSADEWIEHLEEVDSYLNIGGERSWTLRDIKILILQDFMLHEFEIPKEGALTDLLEAHPELKPLISRAEEEVDKQDLYYVFEVKTLELIRTLTKENE